MPTGGLAMSLYLKLLLGLLRRALRSRDDLFMENLVLRQQLAVYARRPKAVAGDAVTPLGHGVASARVRSAYPRRGAALALCTPLSWVSGSSVEGVSSSSAMRGSWQR